MIHRIDPPIALETPQGELLAHWLCDYGPENYFYFLGFLTNSGECWYFDNTQVRATVNLTWGRAHLSPISPHGNCGTQK